MGIAAVFLFVILYGTIQSVFGVGLLLFGTPTLLLLGYPFTQALAYVLPCSIAVNLLQVTNSWKLVTLKKDFVIYCLPLVILGLLATIFFLHSMNIKPLVGILLLITAAIRSVDRFRNKLEQVFRKLSKPSLALIGTVHGLTNMGGGLLTIFISSLYREKQTLRANIAFGYLLMASCQIVVLICTRHEVFNSYCAPLMLTAVVTYMLVGNKIFHSASNVIYQRALTLFIAVFGILLLR